MSEFLARLLIALASFILGVSTMCVFIDGKNREKAAKERGE